MENKKLPTGLKASYITAIPCVLLLFSITNAYDICFLKDFTLNDAYGVADVYSWVQVSPEDRNDRSVAAGDTSAVTQTRNFCKGTTRSEAAEPSL